MTAKAGAPARIDPNRETIKAMQAARQGDTKKVGTPEDLLADLHADD